MTRHHIGAVITVSELAGRIGSVLSEVEAGTAFTVTRRGVPIAVLEPIDAANSVGTGGAPHVSEAPGKYGTALASRPSHQPASALARLIGTPATRAVLAIYLLDPTLALHQRELARRANVGLRSAQIALERLEGLGLLASERDGNRRYYRAVRSQRFEDLRALLSRELGVAEVIARHLAAVSERISWAFVFGSAASGQDTVSSDIDLVVVSGATDDELVEPIARAQRELGRDIELVSYRPDEFERKREEGNHFIRSVLGQPRYDVIGGPDGA